MFVFLIGKKLVGYLFSWAPRHGRYNPCRIAKFAGLIFVDKRHTTKSTKIYNLENPMRAI